jgi:peptidoglycan/LPS O-acetylase OafA/YrhL
LGFALGAALFLALSTPPSWFKFGYILAGGAFATLIGRPIIRSRWQALIHNAAVVAIIRLVVRGHLLEAHPWLADAGDLLASGLFINVLLAFRYGPPEGFSLLRPKFHKTLADFSFSLYSIHMPILIFARAAVGSTLGNDWATQLATPQNYAVAFSVMGSLSAGYFFSRVTEAKTGGAAQASRPSTNGRLSPPLRLRSSRLRRSRRASGSKPAHFPPKRMPVRRRTCVSSRNERAF